MTGTYRLAAKAGSDGSRGAYLPNDDQPTSAPFRWTPNVQLITKVYLKKHLSQARTYTLIKKDMKMVTTAMTKKL